jgi:hypothetical protein
MRLFMALGLCETEADYLRLGVALEEYFYSRLPEEDKRALDKL